jgi:hypothetical protein
MIAFLLATVVQYDFLSAPVSESIARKCASDVGIPYASDNFTDSEWQEFKRCIIRKVGH